MRSIRVQNLSYALLLGLTATACGGDDGGVAGGSGSSPSSGNATGTTSVDTPTTDTPTTDAPTTDTPTTDTPTTTGPATTGPTTGMDTDTSETTGEPGECPYTPIEGKQGLGLDLVATGFNAPTLVVGDPVDTDVLYVLQKGGAIKRLTAADKTAPAEDWFSLPVNTSSEMGLLGMAFHPGYAENGLIYLLHSDTASSWRVTEFAVEAGSVNMGSARDVLGMGQPATNHNGGMIQFGPDDMLYVSVGDGGFGDDACNNGQDTQTQLGTILRIDPAADGTADTSPGCGTCTCPTVDGFDYTIPADNPFVDDPTVDDAIYAYGFRNPWRFSFDNEDGRLLVSDVGQGSWEEVDAVEAGGNYGWNTMEGNHCFGGAACDESASPGGTNADGLIAPVAEYQRSNGNCSITGLGSYRSCEVPAFDGLYFYADLCSGRIFGLSTEGDVIDDLGPVGQIPDNNGAFGGGYNAHGDVFIASGNYAAGGLTSIYRITAAK